MKLKKLMFWNKQDIHENQVKCDTCKHRTICERCGKFKGEWSDEVIIIPEPAKTCIDKGLLCYDDDGDGKCDVCGRKAELPASQPGEWEKEFDKRFSTDEWGVLLCDGEIVKIFIRQLLEKEKNNKKKNNMSQKIYETEAGFCPIHTELLNNGACKNPDLCIEIGKAIKLAFKKRLEEWIEKRPMDFCNDGDYTDKEMIECLLGVIKNTYADLQSFLDQEFKEKEI